MSDLKAETETRKCETCGISWTGKPPIPLDCPECTRAITKAEPEIERLRDAVYNARGDLTKVESILRAAMRYGMQMAVEMVKERGQARATKWSGTEMETQAKADAWESLQCAAAIERRMREELG
jgi:hypothetical protein